LILAAGVVAVYVTFMCWLWGSVEIKGREYAEVAKMVERSPSMASAVEIAMEDGKISEIEFEALQKTESKVLVEQKLKEAQ
jgi:hypothetical protein